MQPPRPAPPPVQFATRGSLALALFGGTDATLEAALRAPEPSQQRHLETAAWQLLQLGQDLTFTITLPGAAVAAGRGGGSDSSSGAPVAAGSSASGGSSGAASGSSDFEFGGSCEELRRLTTAVAYLEGSVEGLETFGWTPHNGRIRLRRLAADSGAGWGGQPAAGGASFELAVEPPAPDGAAAAWGEAAVPDAAQLGQTAARAAAQPGHPALARLSQRQLNALMDCLDAFCRQHPQFMVLTGWDGPLLAPRPGWQQGLGATWYGVAAAWDGWSSHQLQGLHARLESLRGGSGDGGASASSDASGSGGSSEPASAGGAAPAGGSAAAGSEPGASAGGAAPAGGSAAADFSSGATYV